MLKDSFATPKEFIMFYINFILGLFMLLFYNFHSSVDPLTPKFNFHLNIPHLKIEGMFEVDGKVIMIPIKGNGEITADVCKIFIHILSKSNQLIISN